MGGPMPSLASGSIFCTAWARTWAALWRRIDSPSSLAMSTPSTCCPSSSRSLRSRSSPSMRRAMISLRPSNSSVHHGHRAVRGPQGADLAAALEQLGARGALLDPLLCLVEGDGDLGHGMLLLVGSSLPTMPARFRRGRWYPCPGRARNALGSGCSGDQKSPDPDGIGALHWWWAILGSNQ